MSVQILVGDCRELLAGLPAGSFHTCVTSPPYWGLRDYGTPPLTWPAITYAPLAGLPPCVEVPAMDCSLGLEPTLEAFIGHMLLVFREVRRTLRDDGTLWLNMGDSYAGSRAGGQQDGSLEGPQPVHAKMAKQRMVASRRRDDEPIPRSDVRIPGLKPKDLVGQPWRLALALQADGWWLRSDCIWHKPNPMPESTKDRPTKAHEYVFLLSKSERYYYDAEAIKEPASPDTHERYARGRSDSHKWAEGDPMPGQRQQAIAKGFEHMRKPVGGWASGPGSHTAVDHQQEDETRHGKLITVPTNQARGVGWGHGTDAEERGRGRVHRKVADRPDGAYEDGKSARMGREPGWRTKNNSSFDAAMAVMPEARNKRSVWTVVTEGFPGAHFATFPTKLIEPCILAGCPAKCCPHCGAPWDPVDAVQTCECPPHEPVPGSVLDNFGGSGTTGVVADRHQRNAVLCELNPTYAGLSRDRVTGDAPLLAEVSATTPPAEPDAQQLELGHG